MDLTEQDDETIERVLREAWLLAEGRRADGSPLAFIHDGAVYPNATHLWGRK